MHETTRAHPVVHSVGSAAVPTRLIFLVRIVDGARITSGFVSQVCAGKVCDEITRQMATIHLASNASFAIFSSPVRRIGCVVMMKSKGSKGNSNAETSKQEAQGPKLLSPGAARAELLTLVRLLMREPPPDHDFQTCPICKRYGISSI